MQLIMEQIVQIYNLCNNIKTQVLPLKVAYKFAQLANSCDLQFHFFEQKMKEIINDYGEKDGEGNPILNEDGTSIKVKNGQTEICKNKIAELSALEIEIPDITFTLEELDNLQLTIDNVKILMPLIIKE